jgi:hypothetical protein
LIVNIACGFDAHAQPINEGVRLELLRFLKSSIDSDELAAIKRNSTANLKSLVAAIDLVPFALGNPDVPASIEPYLTGIANDWAAAQGIATTLRSRNRKSSPEKDAKLATRIRKVLQRAKRAFPDWRQQEIRAMAVDLAKDDEHYGAETIRKILAGTFPAMKRLKISGLHPRRG